MIRRRQHHLFAFRQDNGLQHVHRLGDIRHEHPVAVPVENIQVHRRHHRVPHGVLLIQESGIGAGFHLKPVAPFIDNQPDPPVRVVFVHDLRVQADLPFHVRCDGHRLKVIRFGKLCGAVFMIPSARNRIAVHAQPVHAERGVLHQDFRPFRVHVIRSAGDFIKLVFPVLAAEVLIPAVYVRVVFRPHDAAASPAFVADAPEPHAPAVLPAVGPPLPHDGRIPVRVQVFNPFAHLLSRSAADIARDIRFAPDLPAKFQEFMRAEGIVLRHPAPVGVHHVPALLLRSDAVPPVIFVREASARPAQHGQPDLFHRLHHVRPDPFHVRNRAFLSDEDPAVNAVPQVLREMPVNIL